MSKGHTGMLLYVVRLMPWTILGLLFMSACIQAPQSSPRHVVQGGDAERGRQSIQDYGCISCHSVPGVSGADALVGPPLDAWARRRYIAGQFPNTPEYLIQWIMAPQVMIPGSAMPDTGVTEQDARNIAAYLYTLIRGR